MGCKMYWHDATCKFIVSDGTNVSNAHILM